MSSRLLKGLRRSSRSNSVTLQALSNVVEDGRDEKAAAYKCDSSRISVDTVVGVFERAWRSDNGIDTFMNKTFW